MARHRTQSEISALRAVRKANHTAWSRAKERRLTKRANENARLLRLPPLEYAAYLERRKAKRAKRLPRARETQGPQGPPPQVS